MNPTNIQNALVAMANYASALTPGLTKILEQLKKNEVVTANNTHFQLIFLTVNGGQNQTEILFQQQPNLRYARICAVETYCREDMPYVFPAGTQVITGADMLKCALTLETNDADDLDFKQGYKDKPGRFTATQQNFQYIPLAAIHRVQTTTAIPFVRQLTDLQNTYVTWEKSKVNIGGGGITTTPDLAIAFGVWYSWLDQFGNPIDRT